RSHDRARPPAQHGGAGRAPRRSELVGAPDLRRRGLSRAPSEPLAALGALGRRASSGCGDRAAGPRRRDREPRPPERPRRARRPPRFGLTGAERRPAPGRPASVVLYGPSAMLGKGAAG